LPEAVREVPVEIIDTKQPEHGDYACNFAMMATKRAGMPPRQIGEMLQEVLSQAQTPEGTNPDIAVFEAIDVAGTGFINLRLNPPFVSQYVQTILALGEGLARPAGIAPQKLNVEFVSVNPNGPITVGSGRGAAFGDTLCRVFEAAGHTINREYYINDGVNSEQMRRFALSIKAHVLQLLDAIELPQDTQYRGEYVMRVAKNLLAEQSVLKLGSNYELWHYAFSEVCNLLGRQDLLEFAPQIYSDADNCRNRLELLLTSDTPISNLAAQAQDILDLTAATFVAAHGFIPMTWTKAQFEPRYRELVLPALLIAEALQNGQAVNVLDTLAMMDAFTTDVRRFFSKSLETYGTAPDRVPAGFEDQFAELVSSQIGAEARQLPATWYQQLGQQVMLADQAQALQMFGVRFDTWFSEQSLHDSGTVEALVNELIAKGVADDEPYRLKVIGSKKGIESVEREAQASEDEDDSPNVADGAGESSSDGAGGTLWLRSTKFGDDMDRVMRRKDGRLTYISSDVAYHADKFNRPPNADKLITILGPDHHGYIHRLHAVVAAFLEDPNQEATLGEPLSDFDSQIYRSPAERDAAKRALALSHEKLEVVIFQIVRFLKDGQPAPMRKRDGNIYELRDLITELGEAAAPQASEEEQVRIGRDVARFFYLMRSHDTHMDFDIDLATKQSDENPVFYAQYAHARICSVLKKAEEAGVSAAPASEGLLVHPREVALIKKILDLPFEVERCAQDYGVHRLTTFAVELARSFHHFYDACRVIQAEQPELSRARVDLCLATKIALKATFDLLGVSAPEKMERATVTD
jgi:arginyl-tRNA synthetase